jgi:hypothetical protein
MKKNILTLFSSLLLACSLNAQEINVKNGWQLLGATENLNIVGFNNSCVEAIWKYDTTDSSNIHWKAYISSNQNYSYDGESITSIYTGEGFWLKSSDINGCTINLNSSGNQGSVEKAKLTNLANAEVKIFKIKDDGSTTLLFTETTSDGTSLDEIGYFSTHIETLNIDEYYIYQVSSGVNWDSNNDGLKDDTFTNNNGTIRVIAKGKNIVDLGSNLNITYASEIVYKKLATNIQNSFDANSFGETLSKASKEVLDTDVNNDNTIDELDIILFNPITNTSNLSSIYENNKDKIVNNINSGKTAITRLSNYFDSFNTSGDAYDVVISSDNTKAYVADIYSGLKIIDISNSTSPSLLSSFDLSGEAYDITLSSDGDIAYIATKDSGLQIVDISNSSKPILLGSYYTSGSTNGVTISSDGTKAYIADSIPGLQVVDISDKSAPALLGTYNTRYKGLDVTLSSDGNKAYVVDLSLGLQIIDVSLYNVNDL